MDTLHDLTDRVLARIAVRTIGAAAYTASFSARALAEVRGTLRDLSVLGGVPYGSRREQRLDVVRLREMSIPAPVLLYLHGGGFQQLSRHSHWWFAAQFARAGYLVLNADYRLAPAHAYPAAVDDVRLAFEFAVAQAAKWGGDASRIVVAGESAGANLALGLAISGRPVKPRAAVLFSGLLQVSHPGRLFAGQAMPRVLRARIESITRQYARTGLDRLTVFDPYLDPLPWLEQHPELAKALPPIYASVGTRDPVVSDMQRLERALEAAGVPHRVEVYPGEPHAFQGMPFRPSTAASWRSCLGYLTEVVRAD